MSTEWFATTPEAILRAESILNAFGEGREEDIGGMLALDQDGSTDPVALLVALIVMADRLAEYAARLHARVELEDTPRSNVTREAARTVAVAHYRQAEADE